MEIRRGEIIRWLLVAALAGLSLLSATLAGLAQDTSPNAPDAPNVPGAPNLPPNTPGITYGFTPVITSLSQPVFVTHAGDARLFVVEKAGIIRIFQNGSLMSTPFLNITGLVWSSGSEEGLLGLAFEPHYQTTGRFYVYYTNNNGDQAIVRYNVSSNRNVADANSDVPLMIIPHPSQSNHNGGWLGFGLDNNLYAGVGDGGGGGDPYCTAQNANEWRGKILRINVVGQVTYTIPSGNIFTSSQKPEVFAIGLRNPWRASFDRTTGDLYIGDVGQGAREEVNYAPANLGAGVNYGWSQFEGTQPYSDSSPCPSSGIPPRAPLADYGRSLGTTVTGGYVYRGQGYPWLSGNYFYGDFGSGRVWAAWQTSSGVFSTTQVIDTPYNISSFGEDVNGDLYLVDYSGTVYRLTSTYTGSGPTNTPTTTPTKTNTPIPGATATRTPTPIKTNTPVPGATNTQTPTPTNTPSPTPTCSLTPTVTATTTPSQTSTATVTITATTTTTVTQTPEVTSTFTFLPAVVKDTVLNGAGC